MALAQGKLEELKKKILFTFLLLIVFRMAAQVPVPGVDATALKSYFSEGGAGIFDLINTFSGGAFKRFSVLALGIMPYITTSIIFSLLGEVVPQIQELQEDSEGHKNQKNGLGMPLLSCVACKDMDGSYVRKPQKSCRHTNHPRAWNAFRLTTMITLSCRYNVSYVARRKNYRVWFRKWCITNYICWYCSSITFRTYSKMDLYRSENLKV